MEGCRGSDGGLAVEGGGFVSRRQELGWPSPLRMNTPYTLINTRCHAFPPPGPRASLLLTLSHSFPFFIRHTLRSLVLSLSNSNSCFISTVIKRNKAESGCTVFKM